MRAREARSSAVRAASISWRRSAASASRRSVMSKIAPSIQRRPPAPGTSCPRSSTHRIAPSARTMRYSSTNGRVSSASSATDASTRSRSSGWMTLSSVRRALAMKLAAG
jgi:hypothetical protein